MTWCVSAASGRWRVTMSLSREEVGERDELRRRGSVPPVGAGEHATTEPLQAPDHCGTDAADPEHADGQVTQVSPAGVGEPEVVPIGGADDFLHVPDQHQDEHQREVGDAVGCVRDVLDRDPQRFRGAHVDVIEADAARGEVLHADPTQRTERDGRDLGLVAHADAPVARHRDDAVLRHRVARDRGHEPEAWAEPRGTARPRRARSRRW